MKYKRLIAFVALVLIAIFVGYAFDRTNPNESGNQADARSPNPANPGSESRPEKVSASSSSVAGDVTPASPAAADSGFADWIRQEARELDRVNVDGEQKRRELRTRIANLTKAEIEQLLATAMSHVASAGEKILSTYLLVEGGSRTQGQLAALIMAPFKESVDFAPHSEEEMKGIREKSLRIMAIDGLFSRAHNDPDARRELARVAAEAHESSVRAYARDKLRQLR